MCANTARYDPSVTLLSHSLPPCFQECTNIFSSGGGETLAKYANIELLVSIPIEPKLGECCDNGINFIETYRNSETYARIKILATKVIQKSKSKPEDTQLPEQ